MEDLNRIDDRDKELKSDKPSEDRFKAIREAFQMDLDAVKNLYDMADDDFQFGLVPGNQWDTYMSGLRGSRPKREYNVLRTSIKQVINDNRQNTPSIKVRPTKDGTKEIADIRQSLIRNIESVSNADVAYDWAAMYAISGGYGVVEVCLDYEDDDSFHQDIRIKRVPSPFAVFYDCAARELDRTDSRRAWKVEQMPRSEFRRKYPDAEVVEFEARAMSNYAGWFDRDTVRVCDYWYKKTVKRRIYQLTDGSVVEADEFDKIAEQLANPPPNPDGTPSREPLTVAVNDHGEKMERTVESHDVYKEIISGHETLEGPFRWPGKFIPLIPMWGDIVCVDGADYFYGMVRPARDAQIDFNYSQSNLVEVIASQPKAPWLYTAKMIEGFEKQWEGSAVDNAPGLPYNPDPTASGAGGMPKREPPPIFPDAWFSLSKISNDNLKAVTGIHDASLGARSNETSGKAILARQHEGDVATYDYSDNIVRCIQQVGVVVNDLIDTAYDAERDIRVLGADMSEDYIRINKPVLVDGRWIKENDITQGKYDVVVTTGPSFTTQRMELLDVMAQLAQTPGPTSLLGAYGTMKYMDVPGTDEYVDALRKLVIQAGIPLKPEEGDQPPAPPQPNPKDVSDAKKNDAMAENYAAEAQGKQIENQQKMMQFGFDLGRAGLDLPAQAPPMGAMQNQIPPQ